MKTLKRLILCGLAAFSFTLASCDNPVVPPTEECINHYDSNSDGKCDNCGAEMPTEKQEFTGLTFKNETFTYDGKEHSIYVKGVPDFATVSYTNNGKTDPGTYTVSATVKATGYKTKKLSAKLTIEGLTFEGVTFEDKTFDYDGKAHSLEVSGAPEGSKVTYTNNSKINVGTYKVTAAVSKTGYNDLKLEATLTINPIDFEGLVFEDKTFEYDGNAHSLAVENVPTGARVTYNGNGKTAVGTYTVTATVSKTGYNTKTLTAKLEITPEKNPVEVDSTKTAFTLDNETKFDDFKDAIFEGNFTLEYEGGTRFLYYSGTYDGKTTEYTRVETSPYEVGVFGADGDQTAYQRMATIGNDPVTYKTTYTKVVGDYAFSKVVDTVSSTEYFTKIPATAFEETFLKQYPAQIFDHVERTSDNGFKVIDYLDFHEYYAEIEFSENKFTLEFHDHIVHDDLKRVTQEYKKFIFYNVGNTKVNIASQHIGSVSKAGTYKAGTFIYDGIEYESKEKSVIVNITLSYGEVIYLPKGHLKLFPDVYGVPVKVITMDFYTAKWGDHAADYTGFTLDTEFNSEFKYCLKYKTYGYLDSMDINRWSPKSLFDRFISFGGQINYHGPDVVDIGFFQDRTSGSLQDLDKYNVSVINADYYTDAQIKKIQATGTKVFGYLNVGLISKSASYYNDFKDIMLKDYELDSNYSWIDVSNSSWKNYVRNTLIASLYNRGLDGIYLAGTRIYEQYSGYVNKYDARQSIGDMILRVDYLEIEVMADFCDSMMEDFKGDGNNAYAPYYVDYYIQEEVFTKVTDRATNEFTAQSSEVETDLKNKIINQNNLYDFNVVLLEYEVDKATNDKIESYCAEMGYHCCISNNVILN